MSNNFFGSAPPLPNVSHNTVFGNKRTRKIAILEPTPSSTTSQSAILHNQNGHQQPPDAGFLPASQASSRSSLPSVNNQAGVRSATTSQMLGATPSAEYSWRAPSPPHIHVPQAPDDSKLILDPYYGFQCKPEHQEILIHLTQGDSNSVTTRDWKYEWRRQAQQITKSLHLGPSNAARDMDALREEGITMLLAVRDSTMALARFLSGEKVASRLGIEADCIDVAGNTELIAGFPQAIEKINDHLVKVFQHRVSNGMSPDDPKALGKVLIFCESGNERSATVAAAYLMHMYDLDEIQSIQYIQTQRFCVAFDDALKHLLRSYRELLQARDHVTKANAQALVASKAKRGRDDMDMDDDMELEQQDDVERFGKRSAFTPFH